jgi:hypothetical protein
MKREANESKFKNGMKNYYCNKQKGMEQINEMKY